MSLKIINDAGKHIVTIEDDGSILNPDGTGHIFKEDNHDENDNLLTERTGVQADQQESNVSKRDEKAVDPVSRS